MDKRYVGVGVKVIASVGIVLVTEAVCRQIPHINQTAIALALLLVLELIAINLGFLAATVSTFVASGQLLLFFVRLHGWSAVGRVEWVAVLTFTVVAMITIRLSDQARSRTIEAAQRAEEMLLLHKFGQEILPAENSTATIERGLSAAVNIFSIDGVAFRLLASGEIFRAGTGSSKISENQLRVRHADGDTPRQQSRECTLVSVEGRHGPLGMLGFYSAKTSLEVLGMIGCRLAMYSSVPSP